MKAVLEQNLTTLSHGIELAAKVIKKVAGNEVATTVNGVELSNNEIKRAIAAKMQSCLKSK